MRKIILFITLGLGICLLLVACSNSQDKDSAGNAEDYAPEEHKTESNDYSNSMENADNSNQTNGESRDEASSSSDAKSNLVERKIIYTANLAIEVKNYQQSLHHIQTKVSDLGGYVVDTNMNSGEGEEMTSGYITARIPQDAFQEFIKLVEDGSNKVLESSISGQDVTEEYVDLESRLKSKRVVEKRLLSFMEQAEKTEDLLTISGDLATVQEEIEEIAGRMKYLENKAELATVTINIQENNVSLTSMNDKDLNTWEKTKQQFLKSINMLLSFFSSLIVFIVGNLPVLILLALIGLITFMFIKKRKKNDQKDLE